MSIGVGTCGKQGAQEIVINFETKVIKETLDKTECELFEMTVQHKSKLLVYSELK